MKTLALNILDIVQNSIRAQAASISVSIMESESEDTYIINIEDDGRGIPSSILKKVTDPFVTTRTKRRMGMGLALMKYHAGLADGKLDIWSETGKGTMVTVHMSHHHIDRQPLGDIGGVMKILIGANPAISFNYTHATDKGSFNLSTDEIKKYLDLEQLTDYVLIEDIRNMINNNLEEIEASGLELKTEA